MDKLKVRLHTLLRQSERIFKTDMVYLARGGFWLSALQVVSALSSFVLAIGFARFLSKDAYGTYKYIMSIGGILASFSLTGLSTVVTNAAARGQDGTLQFAFKKNLAWGLLTFAIFVGSASYYFLHHNTLLAWGLLIIGIVTPLLGSASLVDSFLIGKKDFRRSSITSGVAIVVTNGVTLVVAVLTKNILALISAYMLTSVIVELSIYLYAITIYRPHGKPTDPETVSYGAHLSLIGIFNVVVDRLDSILAFHYLGAVELATYSFAIAIPEQAKGLIKNVAVLALPKFSEKNLPSAYKSMKEKMPLLTIGIALAIVVYLVLARYIFLIFFPQYLGEAVLLSQVYMITLLPSTAVLPSTLLQAASAKRELYLFNVISGVVQILLMGIGTGKFGLWGLVIGIGLSRVFRLIYVTILTDRVMLKA